MPQGQAWAPSCTFSCLPGVPKWRWSHTGTPCIHARKGWVWQDGPHLFLELCGYEIVAGGTQSSGIGNTGDHLHQGSHPLQVRQVASVHQAMSLANKGICCCIYPDGHKVTAIHGELGSGLHFWCLLETEGSAHQAYFSLVDPSQAQESDLFNLNVHLFTNNEKYYSHSEQNLWLQLSR